jgi:lipid II:glycine glycyltransferase (peptidoglycan interpeptide bridge formation enzyme)
MISPEQRDKVEELTHKLSLACDETEIVIVIAALFSFQNNIMEYLSGTEQDELAKENLVKSYEMLAEHVREVLLPEAEEPRLH